MTRIATILLGFLSLALAAPLSRAGEAEKQTTGEIEIPAITPGDPITLAEALRLADQRNLSLAAARTDIIKAQADLKTAWSYLLPTASGSLTFTHNDHPDFINFGGITVVGRRQDDLAARLRVDVPLIHVPSWYGVGLGNLGEEMAELSVEQLRQTLLLSVAQAYYQSLTALSLIEVQRNQIRSSQRHLTVASIRHRSGTGQRLDVIRAQTEVLTVREQLIAAHAALDDARDALATLLAVEGLPLPQEVAEMQPPRESDEKLLALARTQREDLKLARTAIRLADKTLSTSWMQFLPSLVGSWQMSYQVTDPSSFTSEDKLRWFYAITLSVPLYDHARYADLDGKRAALHRSELEAQNAEWQARLEVRQARRAYTKAMEQVATAGDISRLAAQALTLAETAYENGTGNSLDVTDARRSSRSAEIDFAVKRFESQLALLQLLRAVGEDMSKLGNK